MWYSLKYTDDVPEGTGGYARYWFIRLRPKYKDDLGILRHEEEHVRQFYVTLGLHGIMYRFLKKYRLWREVQAYYIQLCNPPADQQEKYRWLYASYISEDYGLSITIPDAYELLR